jgi:YD repeat-containing protein
MTTAWSMPLPMVRPTTCTTSGSTGNGTGTGPHQACSVDGQLYTYDINGNLTSGGGRTLTWNNDQQPLTITGPDAVQETYRYDADGQRARRTRSGVTTYYLGGLLEEESTGTTRTLYTMGAR